MSDVQIKVLFVCMGNICRSPTAEGVFKQLLADKNLDDQIFADSAGTHSYHIGGAPDSRAQATAKTHGIDLSCLVARQVTVRDFFEFDYILAMDRSNLSNLNDLSKRSSTMPSKASLHLMMEFANNWKNKEVPDPYYGGERGFEEVYKMLSNASQGLLNHITTT